MDVLSLSRWQFGVTTVYHFLMVPLTIGLSLVVAWYHLRWYRSGDDVYLRLTKFFGKLFLINFAMGVVTGIVQEFQFGMNWASYSRFVGDVFGAPLAMEALVAFFLESTFLGLWIFGWGRLHPRIHLATIWAAALGTVFSAYFIIAANSWMQHPVGVRFNEETGRAELTDIMAVLTNSTTLAAFPHVISGALLVASTFVMGVSAWLLLRRNERLPRADLDALRKAMRGAIWLTFAAFVVVAISGDFQARLMFEQQPMKMAAAEALCETETGPGLSVFAVGDVSDRSGRCEVWSIEIPGMLSFLATHTFDATIPGVNNLQESAEVAWGPGDYVPPLAITYWGFRAMIGFGAVPVLFGAWLLWATRRARTLPRWRWLPALSIAVVLTPFLGNIAGWVFTEMGRQPWVVVPNPDGLDAVRLLTADGVSASNSVGLVLTSLGGFALVYGALLVVEVALLKRYIKAGPVATMPPPSDEGDGDTSDDDRAFSIAY